jgi:hypothetical protein
MADSAAHEKDDGVTAAIESDRELQAMRKVLSALVPLKLEGRARVLTYVLNRFGMTGDLLASVPSGSPYGTVSADTSPGAPEQGLKDIRSLKEEKRPRSANEMAAVVAYYLSELAPERKSTINADDIKKYFLQARYPLPNSAPQLLINAKNSGYLQSAGTGQYRLNSVGYNLVMHKLPPSSATPALAVKYRRRRKVKPAKRTPRR